jgi:1-aminocyclopropane-1-carboxylate deaminase
MKLVFVQNDNWELINQYHFGGYGKVTRLNSLINSFYAATKNSLDPIYIGKMVLEY